MTAWAENLRCAGNGAICEEQRNVIPSKEHPHGTKSCLMEAMMLYAAEEIAIAYRARLVTIGYTEMRVGIPYMDKKAETACMEEMTTTTSTEEMAVTGIH